MTTVAAFSDGSGPVWVHLLRGRAVEGGGTLEACRGYPPPSRGEFGRAEARGRRTCGSATGRSGSGPVGRRSSYGTPAQARNLPAGEGMRRFSPLHNAVDAVGAINTGDARCCRTARDIVETRFDSTRVRQSILNAALGSDTAGCPTPSARVP
jgi:hypothetical protein